MEIPRREMLKNSMVLTTGALLLPSGLLSNSIKIKDKNEIFHFTPNWNDKGTLLRHSWEGLGNVDQFRWFVRGDMQEQLAQMQKDLNLRHVRAVGMFDDELRVYGIDPTTWREKERKPKYNWQVIDYAIESLLELGINPMVTTSFMPGGLASGEQFCFTTKANVTPPKDYKEWSKLVTSTIKHFNDRFGESIVNNWYYEVWNEPNLGAFWKGGDKQEFFKLYQTTFDAIKSVNPNLKIGGPSCARAEWVADFIEFGTKNDCLADYIIAHVYNNDSEFAALSPFDGPQSDKINQSPNFLPGCVKGTRKLINELGFKGQIHFNEWGRSWFPSDTIRESQNEAAFIVKSMAECSQHADYFAYWCISDIYDQMGYGAETFHGGYGMLNLQGLKKPSYKAFQLLGKLGETQVPVTNPANNVLQNSFASKSKNGYQFLFYSYDNDFDPETSNTSKINVSFLLPENVNLDRIAIYQVGKTENNILDEWRKLNKPAYLKKEELTHLESFNDLQKCSGKYNIENTSSGKVFTFETESPGVALVEIKN